MYAVTSLLGQGVFGEVFEAASRASDVAQNPQCGAVAIKRSIVNALDLSACKFFYNREHAILSLLTAIGVPGTVKLCEAFVTREAPEAPDESVSRRRCTCSLINDSLDVDVDGEGDDADECDCECGCEGTDYDDADTHTPFLVLNMVLEKFGAPLSTCLKSAMARMRNDAAAAYTTLCMHMTEQFLRALVDVHGLRVAHRDLKPSNVLVEYDVCDGEGASKVIDKARPSPSRVTAYLYRAPELLLGSSFYDTAVDMWSAGCVIAEMFLGVPVFTMPESEYGHLATLFSIFGIPTPEMLNDMRLPSQTVDSLIKFMTSGARTHGMGVWEFVRTHVPDLQMNPVKRWTAAHALDVFMTATAPPATA